MPPEQQPPDQQPVQPPPQAPPPQYPQQPYGQHPYGQQPYAQQPYSPPKQNNKTVAIILGVIGCTGCGGVLILAAVLFPVFNQARQKAMQATCLSNVHQQALGIMMYTMDYDERLPPAQPWMDLTAQYIRNEKAFHCPAVSRTDPSQYGYAFDQRLSGKLQEKIANPQKTLLLYDSTALNRNAADSGVTIALSPPRHNRGANVGFDDGHAKWVTSHPDSANGSPP